MSEEGPSSCGPCYIPTFHLSDINTFSDSRYGKNASQADFYSAPPPSSLDSSTSSDAPSYPKYFNGNTLVMWAIFVRPRHPLLIRTLRDITDIITAEYTRGNFMLMCSSIFASCGRVGVYMYFHLAVSISL